MFVLQSDHGVTGSAESSFTHITPFSVEHISLYASEKDKSLQGKLISCFSRWLNPRIEIYYVEKF